MKKGLIALLALMVIALQGRLWVGEGSLLSVLRLYRAIEEEEKSIATLSLRNLALDKEVSALKSHPAALEERARTELGLIKPAETFYVVVEPAR